MDAELKQKWVAALRSGKYKQGRGQFLIRDMHCCLNVLACEKTGSVQLYGGMGEVWEFIDKTVTDKHIGRLVSMNDVGKPFTEIADYIEANL